MTNISIRKATLNDVVYIRALEKELIEYERLITSTIKKDIEINYYNIPEIIDDNKHSLMLVLEIDDQIMGCGFGQIRANKSHFIEPFFGYLGLICIKQEYRGYGFGGKIIEELLSWFKKSGIREAKLEVYSDNTNAIRSYSKIGFHHYKAEMRIEL